MARYTMKHVAPEGSLFSPAAFDEAVGKQTPLRMNGEDVGLCTLVSYVISEDGEEVTLTFEGQITPGVYGPLTDSVDAVLQKTEKGSTRGLDQFMEKRPPMSFGIDEQKD